MDLYGRFISEGAGSIHHQEDIGTFFQQEIAVGGQQYTARASDNISPKEKVIMKRFTRCVLFGLMGLMGVSVALAQIPTATILGVVTDSTGATVPEAKLTARNVETGQARTATSAADGSYRFSALPVGKFEVRAEKAGFQTDVRSGLTLSVAQ